MPINLRRVSELVDGSVTSAKLADGSVISSKIGVAAVISGKIAADAVGSSEIAANAVTSSELADNAVTTLKLGDGAVTGVKADGSIKTSYLVADDTTISYTGTVYSSEKELRFVKKAIDIPGGEIMVYAEAMASVGTTNIGIFFDAEITPRITLSTVGTGFELLEGTAYIGDLSNAAHSVNMRLRNLNAGVAYNKLIEMHSRV